MFLTTKELAEKWGVDQSRVLRLAREGRIEGAQLIGNSWFFPCDAQKPSDRRTHDAKPEKESVFFRFPNFVNFDESSYYPPLSEEERLLRNAQKAFFCCRFSEAKEILVPLSEKAANRYVRIAAVYHLCYIAIWDNSPDFDTLASKLHTNLSQDFPYCLEMRLLQYCLDADFGYYKSTLTQFAVQSDYVYHPSCYYSLAVISMLPIENGDFSLLSKLRYDTYEVLCQMMEHDGCFFEAQNLHYLLLIVYQLQSNGEKMLFHVRRALTIAMEHQLYWNAVLYAYYYPNITKKVLSEFPDEFAGTILSLGNTLKKRLTQYMKNRRSPWYLGWLSDKEFEFAFLASQGYTNREIARKLKISEKIISKFFCGIYDKLGISNRKKLIEIINSSMSDGKLDDK